MMDNIFLSELGVVLGVQPAKINLDASFVYNGGHSLSAAALITKCKAQGFTIKYQTLMISPSLKEVMAATVEIPGHKVMKSSAKQIFQISEPSPSLSAADKGQQDDFLEAVPSLQNGTSKAPSREDKRNQYHGGTVDHLVTDQGLRRFDIAKAYQLPISPALTPKLSSELISEDHPERLSSPIQTPNFEDGSFTEMQLSLMHGSMKTPGMNVITHAETFHSKDIPLMKLAWKMVIEQEPIFCIKALLPEDGRSFYWYDPQIDKDEFSLNAFIALSRDHVCSTFEVAHQEPLHTPHSLSTITWRVHHALIDGFSAYLLFDKVRQVASGIFVKPSPPFSDTVQDLKRLQESQRKEGNAFWAKKNEQNPSTKSNLLLHSMDEQLEHEKSQSAEVVLDMKPMYEKLVVFAREMNVTSATIFNAAWVLVLSSYADSDSVVFGAVLSGRDLPILNAASVIGPLVNMLPFFVTINREDTVHQFLRTVYEEMVELREYQWTTPENGFSRDFDSALVVQLDQPALDNGFVQAIGRPQTQQATSTPLTVIVEGDGTVHFNYHYRRFNRQNIERISSYFYETIQMLMRTSTTIEMILMGLMPAMSQKLLMENGNCLSGLTTRTSVDQDLVTLFESRVRKNPDDIAVERGQDYLTYQKFDEAATKVMSRLKTKIMPGDVVCVHSDRSINWIVAIFGILKAEGIYCSLSNDLPVELRNTMYQSAGAKVYLTPDISQEESCPDSCDTCWAIDTILEEEPTSIDAKESHRKQPIPWATAYLCFTSGSTGTPKGVMCTHEGLVAFQSDLVVRLLAQPGIKISQIMSPAFDGSIHEIFSALTYGATLVLQVNGDPFGHLGLVDSAILTPSMARILDPRDFERLSTVYLVGEPVPELVSEKWSAQKQLYNMYGPTEGTCGATIKHLTPGCPVTIGHPNPTTRIYILDSKQRLIPPGRIGEIYLAGVQVAKGYLNLEKQTQESFLPDSICRNGERMYKTGDRGYWNEIGEVVCLGRNDRQIKLRGFRLDMNDLEIRVLQAAPQLQAIAIAPRGEHLVAMVQPASIEIQDLRKRISAVLPSYAVMQQILAVEQLPMTSTGKINYKMVAEMAPDSLNRRTSPPTTVTEKVIAQAFRNLLKLDQKTELTTDSDFIDLGGHSLLQLSMSSRLTKAFGFRIPLRLIIENPTIIKMAHKIDEYNSSTRPVLPGGLPLTAQQVSPIEMEWLKKFDIDSGSTCFNVCYTSTFNPEVVNRSALSSAWNTVLTRHKIFRSRYVTRNGRLPIRIDADTAPLVERVSDINLWTEANRPFKVHNASPIRVFVTKDRLLVAMSHIIADYTTLSIMLKEASAVYSGQKLSPITKTYPDSTVWNDSVPPCYLEFWSQYLDGCAENSPLMGKQLERTGYCGTSSVSRIPSEIYHEMLAYCENTKLSLQQIVMAATALCLQLDTPETDILLGSPYINRNSDEDLEMVGLFLVPLPVRIRYPDYLPKPQVNEDRNLSFLDAVQKSIQSALAHAIPWHQLLEHLDITPCFPNHPLFDTMVTFHDNRQNRGLDMAIPSFQPSFIWSEGAKFKLMLEFSAISENQCLLRIEHDPTCVFEEDISLIEALVPKALGLLVRGESHDEIKQQLLAFSKQVGKYEKFNARNFFGKRLCEL